MPLESRPATVGHRAFRGVTVVCTRVDELQQFVADAGRLDEWVPFTEAAHAVAAPTAGPESGELYYVRTSAPWPLKSRDMVYRLSAEPAGADGTIHLRVEGRPDAVPERRGAVRMQAAQGAWVLTPVDGRIRVMFRLAVDAGRVPGFLADRRLAATVGGTLANLAERFPCPAAADTEG